MAGAGSGARRMLIRSPLMSVLAAVFRETRLVRATEQAVQRGPASWWTWQASRWKPRFLDSWSATAPTVLAVMAWVL